VERRGIPPKSTTNHPGEEHSRYKIRDPDEAEGGAKIAGWSRLLQKTGHDRRKHQHL